MNSWNRFSFDPFSEILSRLFNLFNIFLIVFVARKDQVQVEKLGLSQMGVGEYVYEFSLSKCLWDQFGSNKNAD